MSMQMQIDMLQQQVNMLQHQMALLTQHFRHQEFGQSATQIAMNAQVVQNAARQMPPLLHVTQYKNTELPQPTPKKLTMVEILKKAQDFHLLGGGSESRPESRNDGRNESRASRAFTPTERAEKPLAEKPLAEKPAAERPADKTAEKPAAPEPKTAIALAKKNRTRIDADTLHKDLYEIARETDGRMLVHGGEIPKYIWPLDTDGEPYEGLKALAKDFNIQWCHKGGPEIYLDMTNTE